jgi:hypothetical protein
MPRFEVYTRGGGRGRRAPQTVTITPLGRISFSASAYEALGSPAAVVYLTDRGEQLVGFRAAGREERNAFRVNPTSRTASAAMVLGHMGVALPESRRWPLLADDGTPHIDLKQPGTVVTSNRRKKQPAN